MARLALQDLGCNVVGSAADGFLFFSLELEFGGQSEVSQLELHAVAEEEVAQLEVSVDDLVAVELLKTADDLEDLALHLHLGQAFASAQLLVDGLVVAHLQQNLDLLRVLEEVVEPHNVGMLQRTVDTDFAHQLLLGTRLHEGTLGDHLGGQDLLGLEAGELLHSCEPSLAQEFTLGLLDGNHLAVEGGPPFLNDGGCFKVDILQILV